MKKPLIIFLLIPIVFILKAQDSNWISLNLNTGYFAQNMYQTHSLYGYLRTFENASISKYNLYFMLPSLRFNKKNRFTEIGFRNIGHTNELLTISELANYTIGAGQPTSKMLGSVAISSFSFGVFVGKTVVLMRLKKVSIMLGTEFTTSIFNIHTQKDVYTVSPNFYYNLRFTNFNLTNTISPRIVWQISERIDLDFCYLVNAISFNFAHNNWGVLINGVSEITNKHYFSNQFYATPQVSLGIKL